MKIENDNRGSRDSFSSSNSELQIPSDVRVVKMKGLPFKANEPEIKEFFQNNHLSDILEEGVYMKKHADGRPNGEAFVVFDSADSAECARGLDKKKFNEGRYGDRFVRVYPMLAADMPELERAMVAKASITAEGSKKSNSSQQQHDSVVRVKSLPFDANQADLIEFFRTFNIKPNGVQLVVRLDGRPTGEAFVDFESYEEALRASKEKDRQVFHPKFGERYVRLILVTRQEMQRVLAERYAGEGILKLKGLPFQCTFAEVRCFFAGYRIKIAGINFVMHSDGRPTGMAFIEFESVHEAIRAMEKDKARFGPEYGDRFVMLSQSSRVDMEKQILKNESEENASALVTGGGSENAPNLSNLSWLLPPLLMAGAQNNGLPGFNGIPPMNPMGLANLQQMLSQMNLNPGALNMNLAAVASGGLMSGGGTPAQGVGGNPSQTQIPFADLCAGWLQQGQTDQNLNNPYLLPPAAFPMNANANGNAITNANTAIVNGNATGNSGTPAELASRENSLPVVMSARMDASNQRSSSEEEEDRRTSIGSSIYANGNVNANGNTSSMYSNGNTNANAAPANIPNSAANQNSIFTNGNTTYPLPPILSTSGNVNVTMKSNGNGHSNGFSPGLLQSNGNVNQNVLSGLLNGNNNSSLASLPLAFEQQQQQQCQVQGQGMNIAQQSSFWGQQQGTWGGLSLG